MVQAIVPDQKFKYLANTWKPPSVVPAVLKIVDIAGLIRGAAEGAGLGNAFLSHIAAVDGIFHLVRAFESDDIVHVDDSVDPIVSLLDNLFMIIQFGTLINKTNPNQHAFCPP